MSNNLHTQHLEETVARLEAEAQALREEVERGNRITIAMALDIAAVGEALGIQGEEQEGGTGEFIDLIRELQEQVAALRARVAPAYTTQPGESLMGIALRQLKDEDRWPEIRDLNADRFADMGPHDYYPPGTVLNMPGRGDDKAATWADIHYCLDAELREWTGDHRKAVERALTDAAGRIRTLFESSKA